MNNSSKTFQQFSKHLVYSNSPLSYNRLQYRPGSIWSVPVPHFFLFNNPFCSDVYLSCAVHIHFIALYSYYCMSILSFFSAILVEPSETTLILKINITDNYNKAPDFGIPSIFQWVKECLSKFG